MHSVVLVPWDLRSARFARERAIEPEHTHLADVWGHQQRQTAGAIDALTVVAQAPTISTTYGPAPSVPFEVAYNKCYTACFKERWGQARDETDDLNDADDADDSVDDDDGDALFGEEDEEEPTTEPSTPSGDDDDEMDSRKRHRPAPRNPRPRQRRRHAADDCDVWNRGECFLCSWGDKFHDGIEAPHVNKLFAIIDECLGIWSKLDIAKAMVRYYNAVVYDAAQGMPRLTVKLVLEHLENHTRDARLFLVNRLDEASQLIFMFKHSIVKADGSYDYKALNEYWRAVDKACVMYGVKLEKWNFNNGKTREDTRLMSNPLQLMRAFTQRRPQLQHHDDVFRIGRR